MSGWVHRSPLFLFRELTFQPFKCFRSPQLLRLSSAGATHRWNTILGDNGTGKTTILRMLAEVDLDRTEVSLAGLTGVSFVAKEPFLPHCIGYGAWRGIEGLSKLTPNVQEHPCRNLLDEKSGIPDPEEWLLQAELAARISKPHAARIKKAQELIVNKLLPDVDGIDFEVVSGRTQVVAKTPYGRIPLRDLSYGYRSSLAWIMDLAGKLIDLAPDDPDPFSQPVVVLIDEIDLHLHPKWQKQLLTTLDTAFPNAQFIVTAHSPLIIQAAPNANVILLKREGDGVVIHNDFDHIREWRVDQILASELFEEQPVHSQKVEEMLRRRMELLGRTKRTKKEEVELAAVSERISKLPTAVLPEDQDAMALIREVAARIRNENGSR